MLFGFNRTGDRNSTLSLAADLTALLGGRF